MGDQYFITALRLAGVDGRKAHDALEAEQVIDQLVKEGRCKILVIPEDLSLKLKKKRDQLKRERQVYPVITIIPGFNGPIGERIKEIHQFISQAVGVKLKLSEE